MVNLASLHQIGSFDFLGFRQNRVSVENHKRALLNSQSKMEAVCDFINLLQDEGEDNPASASSNKDGDESQNAPSEPHHATTGIQRVFPPASFVEVL